MAWKLGEQVGRTIGLWGRGLSWRLTRQALQCSSFADIAAMVVAQLVDRDAPDPTDRIVVVHDAPPAHVGLDERLLDSVGSPLLVAACNRERANETPVVGAKQRFEILDHANIIHKGNQHQR